MFDSGISVKEIIEELNEEVDIALPIPNKTYVTWLNSLQRLLYTEIIKEQNKIEEYCNNSNITINLSGLKVRSGEDVIRFEDIHAIYVGDTQLIKSTVASGMIFPNSFYKFYDQLAINIDKTPVRISIVYISKPALVTVTDTDEINDANVMLPVEFIDLVKAKLRGEAYKLANEDDVAAKWLNDYNTLLETFKVWITDKSPNLGI